MARYAELGDLVELRGHDTPVNVCLHAHPIGGTLTPAPDEATDARWIDPSTLDTLDIHPAIRRRITHALSAEPQPHID